MDMNEKQKEIVVSRTADMLELASSIISEMNERDEEKSFERPAIVELVSVGQLVANMSALGFYREKLEVPIDPKVMSAITKAVMESLDKIIDLKISVAGFSTRVAQQASPQLPARAVAVPAPTTAPSRGPRPKPLRLIGRESCIEAGQLLAEIWSKGMENEIPQYMGGWLASEGVDLQCARLILSTASDKANSDTELNIMMLEHVYGDFTYGSQVMGVERLQQAMRDRWSGTVLAEAERVIARIDKIIRRPQAD